MQEAIQIPLRRRDGAVCAYAMVDQDDAAQAERRWYRLKSGYVVRVVQRNRRRRMIYLHRAVLGLTPGDGLEGDHLDGNRLDCRRSNLRIVTHAQNQQNSPSQKGSSTFRGVSWNKRDRRWYAFVQLDGHANYLGCFTVEADAAEAAARFRREHMTHTCER